MKISDYLQSAGLARYPFLFVVTHGRSGSTLMQGLLNALDGYCIRGENDGALFHIFKAIESLKWAKGGRTKADRPTHPWFGVDGIDPDAAATALVDDFFAYVLRAPPGTRCCGFKEIRYTSGEMSDSEFDAYMSFLQNMFPGAGFIFNLRSVDDTSKSGWWSDMPFKEVDMILSNAHRRLERQSQHIKHSLLFSYDAWMDDARYVRLLFEFLNEPYDNSLVARVRSTKHSY